MNLHMCSSCKDLSRYTETSITSEVKEKSINQMSNSRQEKITRYKEQKEQERKLKVRGVKGPKSRELL